MNSSVKSTLVCVQGFKLPKYALGAGQKNGLIFLSVVNTLLACPTFLANLLVLLVIWRKPCLRNNAVYLLAFLAVSDVMVGLAVQPLFVAYTLQVLFNQVPSCFVMVAYDVLSFLLCFWSAATSLILTMDRCVAVLYPYKYGALVTVPRLVSGVLFTWLAWAMYVFSRFFGANGRTFALVRSSTFLVSILVTTVVYVKMVLISRKHEGAIAAQEVFTENQRSMVRERKALKTAVYVVGAYLVCYLPLTVCLQMFFIVVPPKQTRFVLAHWCTTLVFLDSLLNPVIYWWRLPRMRRALLELLKIQSPAQQIIETNTRHVHSARNSAITPNIDIRG